MTGSECSGPGDIHIAGQAGLWWPWPHTPLSSSEDPWRVGVKPDPGSLSPKASLSPRVIPSPRATGFCLKARGLAPLICPTRAAPVLTSCAPGLGLRASRCIYYPGPHEGSSELLYVGTRNLGLLCPVPQMSCQTPVWGSPNPQHPAKATGPQKAPSRRLGQG